MIGQALPRCPFQSEVDSRDVTVNHSTAYSAGTARAPLRGADDAMLQQAIETINVCPFGHGSIGVGK